jgi:hypothetical protein
MRIPRFQFTVRRMMAVVTISGFLAATVKLWRDSDVFAAKAAAYTASANVNAEIVSGAEAIILDLTGSDDPVDRRRKARLEGNVIRCRPLQDYYRDLANKYARAARYPWLRVEPDPPEPK